MKVSEHVTVEAGRQQAMRQAQDARLVPKTSRNDLIVFLGTLALVILSVVALILKGP